MKSLDQYTIYCTAEQTKKALELGVPMQLFWEDIKENFDMPYCEISPREDDELGIMCNYVVIPTAEQMIGWLEEQEAIDEIAPMKKGEYWAYVVYMTGLRSDIESPKDTLYPARPEATLAAIDSALDYLIKNKK